ncbi:MAG: DUF6265 family protein [Pyrinomonadaceae bacterium]
MRILTVLLFSAAAASVAGQSAKIDVSTITWLPGCWERQGERSGRRTLEQWTSAEGGSLFGVGRTIANGKAASWEFMRIEQSGESAIFSALLPGAKEATAFKLKSTKSGEVVFENLENDFPHRVIYRKGDEGKLNARIEGKMDGEERGIDFSFARVACGSADDATKMMIAKGEFAVKVTPVADDAGTAADGIGRLSLNKTFSGDMAGTSKGQMLGASNESQTVGGYVAMETFTGTLAGRKGSFILQHNGTMNSGQFSMHVEVVPGSGKGELAGIAGKLKIIIEGKKHLYELEYSLPK